MENKYKKIRIDSGLSQAETAKLLGVSKSCISAWENGLRIPGVEKVLSYINAFGLDADYFNEDTPPASNASRCFDMTLLNANGAKKMYELYLSLIEDEEYLKKS